MEEKTKAASLATESGFIRYRSLLHAMEELVCRSNLNINEGRGINMNELAQALLGEYSLSRGESTQ